MRTIITILLAFACSRAIAQPIILDDFSSADLSNKWTGSATFQLSIDSEALKVDYTRTPQSGQWDQFNFDTSAIELASYSILIAIQSDVNFELAVKPVYEDGSDDWLTYAVSPTEGFEEVQLSSNSNDSRILDRIYFYFDGGSSANKSGAVYFDYIKIDQSASTAFLDQAIANAWELYDYVADGEGEGAIDWAVKSAYESKIQDAEAVANEDNLTATDVRMAIDTLNDATYTFEASIFPHPRIQEQSFTLPGITFETRNLYSNLIELAKTKLIFGMQDATGYGVGWTGNNDRSDVKDVCGDYPALGAWSIKSVAQGNNFDGEAYRMQKFFNLGGLNTVEWHMDSPYGGGFYWDDIPAEHKDKSIVASLLPGAEHHAYFKERLDNIIFYLRNLKGEKGQSIPVIFRPFHEHNGDWFWWGRAHCSVGEYVQLWRFVVDYFKENKVNNVLFAYSPDRFHTKSNYLERFPGDAYVDILGFDDYYDLSQESGISDFKDQLETLVLLASEKNKIAALTETGNEGIQFDNWFTHFLLDPILENDITKRIAYAAVWRNANVTHHFAPYPGHASVPDFLEFYNAPETIFMEDMPEVYNQYNYGDKVLNARDKLVVEDVTIYPVPASDVVHIDTHENLSSVEVYNHLGQNVLKLDEDKLSMKTLEVSHFHVGQYIMKIRMKDGLTYVKKLVVQ